MRPEQSRALDYLDRKGTRAPAELVSREVAEAFDSLERKLDSLSGLPPDRRPAPDQWSLIEVVDHLTESHRRAARQLRAALAGADPGPAIPAGLQSAAPTSGAWSERVSELKAVHVAFLDELSRGADSSPPSEIPIVMVVEAAGPDGSIDALEWMESLHWKAFAIAVKVHTLQHLAQVERVVGVLSSEPGDR